MNRNLFSWCTGPVAVCSCRSGTHNVTVTSHFFSGSYYSSALDHYLTLHALLYVDRSFAWTYSWHKFPWVDFINFIKLEVDRFRHDHNIWVLYPDLINFVGKYKQLRFDLRSSCITYLNRGTMELSYIFYIATFCGEWIDSRSGFVGESVCLFSPCQAFTCKPCHVYA